MHLAEAEDREPVEQGGEAEGEVVDSGWGGEYALLDAAGDDGGEVIAPEGQQLFQELAHLPVVRCAGPGLHPEDPARIRWAGGQVEADEPLKLAPGAGHLGQGGAGPDEVLVVPPGQGLQQYVFLAGEVVHPLAGAHVGPPGYLGHPHLVDSRLGDQLHRGLEDPLAAALPVLGAGWATPARYWSGDSRDLVCAGHVRR